MPSFAQRDRIKPKKKPQKTFSLPDLIHLLKGVSLRTLYRDRDAGLLPVENGRVSDRTVFEILTRYPNYLSWKRARAKSK